MPESAKAEEIEKGGSCPAAEVKDGKILCLLYGDHDCGTGGYLGRQKGDDGIYYCIRKKQEDGKVLDEKHISLCIE